MKNDFFSLILFCFIATTGLGQCPSGLAFTTQTQIDNFSSNFPGCTALPLALEIISDPFETDTIKNLNGLSQLTSVGAFVTISEHSLLTNLDGLNQLTSIGHEFYLNDNPNLTNIDALSQLTTIGGDVSISANSLKNLDGLSQVTSIGGRITIEDNHDLTNLDGLSQVTSIGGDITVEDNHALTNLDGFSQVTSVGGIVIKNNDLIKNVDGFSQTTSVGGIIVVDHNDAITNLDGFSQITSLGAILIKDNSSIKNVDGFSQVTSLGGDLLILRNDSITNLDGFSQIKSVGQGLKIESNSLMTNVNGLNQLTSIGLDLVIRHNNQLDQCCALCPLLTSNVADPTVIGGNIITYNNSGSCYEGGILNCNPCGVTNTTIPEDISLQLTLFPNPVKENLQFQYDSSKDELINFTVENQLGQQLFKGETYTNELETVDVSEFAAGVYLLRIAHGDHFGSQLFSVSR